MTQDPALEKAQPETLPRDVATRVRWDGSASPRRTWLAAYVAEGIGVFGLVFAGCGAIMIDALSQGQITHVGGPTSMRRMWCSAARSGCFAP